MDDEKPTSVTVPNPDPVTHPTIKIGNVDFEVKFTMLQVMRLEESGIKFTETFDDNGVLKERTRTKWSLRDVFTGIASMISTSSKKYNAEEVAEMVGIENAGDVMSLFATAVKKVLSQAKRPTTSNSPSVSLAEPVN